MQFVKISFFINENEIHACFEPFHREKMSYFLVFSPELMKMMTFFSFFILSDVITVFSLRQINPFWKCILMFLLENNKWQDRNGIHWKWRIGENEGRNAHKHYKQWSVIFVRIYDAEKRNAEVMDVVNKKKENNLWYIINCLKLDEMFFSKMKCFIWIWPFHCRNKMEKRKRMLAHFIWRFAHWSFRLSILFVFRSLSFRQWL